MNVPSTGSGISGVILTSGVINANSGIQIEVTHVGAARLKPVLRSLVTAKEPAVRVVPDDLFVEVACTHTCPRNDGVRDANLHFAIRSVLDKAGLSERSVLPADLSSHLQFQRSFAIKALLDC